MVLSGGHPDSPGSGLQRGSASSQSASADAAPELSGRSQTPKCPASRQSPSAPHSRPSRPRGLYLPPPRSLTTSTPGWGKTFGFGVKDTSVCRGVAGPTLNTPGPKGNRPSPICPHVVSAGQALGEGPCLRGCLPLASWPPAPPGGGWTANRALAPCAERPDEGAMSLLSPDPPGHKDRLASPTSLGELIVTNSVGSEATPRGRSERPDGILWKVRPPGQGSPTGVPPPAPRGCGARGWVPRAACSLLGARDPTPSEAGGAGLTAGRAKKETPMSVKVAARSLPFHVWGYLSP